MSESRAKTTSDPLDLPPDSAPIFGGSRSDALVNRATGPGQAPRMLSLRGQHHGRLGGRYALPGGKGTGFVTILPAPAPGFVHIDADIDYAAGGTVRYEAEVRESWLGRLSDSGDCSPARIVHALTELAELPHQTTVRVHLQT
jgi:hypothetical protein